MGYPDFQTYGALATLIAQALQSSGIPVLGDPVPLYNVVAQSGSGQPALVGATVGGSAWNPNLNHAQAMAAFNTYVNGNPCNVASKSFFNGAPYPTSIPATDQALIAAGAWIYLSVKPSTTFSTAEDARFAALLQLYITAGAKIKIILWHEPQNTFPSINTWQAYWAHYQPIVKAAGLECIYDAASHAGETGVASWWPNVTPDAALQDIYWSTYQNGITWGTLISLCAQHGIPPGIGEWNVDSNSSKTPTTQQWNGFTNQMITDFQNVMLGGGNVEAIMYYMSSDAPAQPNNLLLSSSDWKVAQWNAIQAGLSVPLNFPGQQINAGQSVTFNPIAGSPAANYAIANGQGYDLVLILTTSTGSTQPFVSVEIDWMNSDVVHAPLFHSERWQVPCGQAGSSGAITTGRGPQLAAFVGVKLTNRDTVPVFAQLQLNSTGRQQDRHDLRWDAPTSVNIPGYTLAGGQGYSLELGEIDTVNITSGNAKTWLFSMFAGQAYLRVVVNGAAGVKTVHVSAAPQPLSRFGITNLVSQYLPITNAVGDNDQSWLIALPRGPLAVTITNTDANTVSVGAELIGIEPG